MLAENRSTPRSDEELQKLTVGELKPHNAPITIVEYDPSWPDLFEREANRIRSVLGTKALQIEHVGSTSVPGLCAKPIIDMLLVVTNSADEPPMFRYWNHLAIRCGFGNPSGSNTACSKDPIPISICMCSVRAHQRLIECYVFEIGCGLMMLIETNMHKLSETWQRINGGMFNTMRTPKRP